MYVWNTFIETMHKIMCTWQKWQICWWHETLILYQKKNLMCLDFELHNKIEKKGIKICVNIR